MPFQQEDSVQTTAAKLLLQENIRAYQNIHYPIQEWENSEKEMTRKKCWYDQYEMSQDNCIKKNERVNFNRELFEKSWEEIFHIRV